MHGEVDDQLERALANYRKAVRDAGGIGDQDLVEVWMDPHLAIQFIPMLTPHVCSSPYTAILFFTLCLGMDSNRMYPPVSAARRHTALYPLPP